MTKFGTYIQLINATTSANTNINSEDINTGQFQTASIQILTSALNASNGVLKIQESNNITDWNDIAGATVTITAATTSNFIKLTTLPSQYIRAVWTKNTVSAGTISIVVNLKR